MKTFAILKNILASIFFSLLTLNEPGAQLKEYAEVRTYAMPLGNTSVYIYYGNAIIKKYSFKAKNADNELVNILNDMAKDGWKIISSDTYAKKEELIFFLERDK